MSKDKQLLYLFWLLTGILLMKFIPREKRRSALIPFMFKQLLTWVFGLLVVENKLIRYPVREFKKANKSSFSFEYFIYPSLCAIFNINYPETKPKWIKFVYHLSFAGGITAVEYMIEKKTKLITYKKWAWYWSFLTIFFTDYVSRIFYRWFLKGYEPK